MEFRTEVKIEKAGFEIKPQSRLLFVGSCFADNLGKRFADNCFRADVNPYGVMYNPVSIFHTVARYLEEEDSKKVDVAIFTLGTNHVYILKETGEVVDNCRKRPQKLFEERELSVEECEEELAKSVEALLARGVSRVIVTVSPIRYAKYGFHGSRLSKATLLLAADKLCSKYPATVSYFPAYEIVGDELRDYRFYQEDMLHPSNQAVEYIWQKFRQAWFGKEAEQFLQEWKPIKDALSHRPFNPDNEEYKRFLRDTRERERMFREKYQLLENNNKK